MFMRLVMWGLMAAGTSSRSRRLPWWISWCGRCRWCDAARGRDAAQVQALLDATPRADVNERAADGTTALHWAVYNNDVRARRAAARRGRGCECAQ